MWRFCRQLTVLAAFQHIQCTVNAQSTTAIPFYESALQSIQSQFTALNVWESALASLPLSEVISEEVHPPASISSLIDSANAEVATYLTAHRSAIRSYIVLHPSDGVPQNFCDNPQLIGSFSSGCAVIYSDLPATAMATFPSAAGSMQSTTLDSSTSMPATRTDSSPVGSSALATRTGGSTGPSSTVVSTASQTASNTNAGKLQTETSLRKFNLGAGGALALFLGVCVRML